YAVFIRSARFFWTVRCHLHFLTGRAEERLSFDLQPELAKRLGYRDRGDQLGVERFMKRYFLAAKDVGSLSRILCAKIAIEQSHQSSGPVVGWLSGHQAKCLSDEPNFAEQDRQLNFAPNAETRRHPEYLVKLFRLAQMQGLDIHPAALSRVTREIRSLKPEFREHPAVISEFLASLLETDRPADILRLMNEAGLLGRLVPEFGGIVAQTQFNMYHHYTVDEHTIRTVEAMSDLEHGRTDVSPGATRQFSEIDNRRALYLAMLLHDTGKGKGDQQLEGMLTARRACKRLGLPPAEVELVAWLVGNHLEMSEIAQKRDIADPRTVTDFAHLVGGVERLRLLYILTISDINGVGPQVWNSWKGQLLAELYNSTEMALRGGRADERRFAAQLTARAEEVRQELLDQRGAIPTLMLEMEPAYWTGFDTFLLSEQADLISTGDEIAVKARLGRQRQATTLTIITPDRDGMFAHIAGFLASAGANIVSAQVYTSNSGSVINVYRLQDKNGRGFRAEEPERIAKLEADLRDILASGPVVHHVRARRNRRESAFLVQPSVNILNDASSEHTVIDVAGRNREGLLYDIAKTLVDNGLSVKSAHVGSYGERVFDAFYVQTLTGGKLLDETVKSALKQQLLAVLERYEPDGPQTPAHKLARAKAKDSF
ncbi:MAG: [protein-PII] uridylyltransferase, partial [Pseudomonadota bacterium]